MNAISSIRPDPRLLGYALEDLPRYTSYPTAPHFQPVDGDGDARRWAAAVDPAGPVSVYTHVPFCDRLCWYCGCHTTVPNGYRRIGDYLARLLDEIALWRDALGPHAGASHLHFGGGSPNALSPDDFAQLLGALGDAFGPRADAEIAVELDPRSLTADWIGAAARAGVTRASLGAQTFAAHVQTAVNRIQPFAMVRDAVVELRRSGIGGLNLDMMYGLPGQTAQDVADSLELALSLQPDRIAVFGYAHVPWFKKHQSAIDAATLPGVEARLVQVETADAVLTGAGWVRVGFDHYARPGDAMALATADGTLKRNFQGYTTDVAQTLVGVGASSISAFREGYLQNLPSTKDWAGAVARGALPVARALTLTAEDRMRRDVIERILCGLEADTGAVAATHGFDPATLDPGLDAAGRLVADGFVEITGRHVRALEGGRRVLRTLAACFDARRVASAARHSAAV